MKGRIHGLDSLRAAAIVLVLMSHYGVVAGGSDFGWVGGIGWIGVDLFFVLSGYLIGDQLLSPRGFSLTAFFGRRLLRTVPNYGVVLAAYFLFPATLGGSDTAPWWRFLSFTQNFGLHYGQTFTHSWSLCVEEQFYVILPLVCLLLRGRWLWAGMALAVAGSISFRALAWHDGLQPFSQEVYYSSFARFDELLPGVAIALLKNHHSALYARILRYGNLLLLAGLGMSSWLLLHFYDETFFITAFGFTLLAFSFSLLVLAALSPSSLLARLRIPGAESMALWSYAIYLVHKPMYKVVLDVLPLDRHTAPAIALVIAAGIGGGWLLYRLVEQPFMHLRALWFPLVLTPIR